MGRTVLYVKCFRISDLCYCQYSHELLKVDYISNNVLVDRLQCQSAIPSDEDKEEGQIVSCEL